MKKYLILFVLATYLGCSEKTVDPIPDSVYSIEKMTNVMVDIQLIEGGIVIRQYSKSQQTDLIKDVYKTLYLKHDVNQREFEQSLKYYTDHPELLETIYEGVMVRLSELEAEVTNEKSEPEQIGN